MTYVSYLRVSTDRQGATGYGIDAQREAIQRFTQQSVLAEYVEVESGKNDNRPQMALALEHCKRVGATLVIAKLDRLSRRVSFVANLLESGVEFVACDNPHANKMTIQIMAVMAEYERDQTSKRTKEALAAAKARGVKLGGYRGADMTNARKAAAVLKKEKAQAFRDSVFLVVKGALEVGGSLTAAASILNSKGVPTSAGASWCAKTVSRVIR